MNWRSIDITVPIRSRKGDTNRAPLPQHRSIAGARWAFPPGTMSALAIAALGEAEKANIPLPPTEGPPEQWGYEPEKKQWTAGIWLTCDPTTWPIPESHAQFATQIQESRRAQRQSQLCWHALPPDEQWKTVAVSFYPDGHPHPETGEVVTFSFGAKPSSEAHRSTPTWVWTEYYPGLYGPVGQKTCLILPGFAQPVWGEFRASALETLACSGQSQAVWGDLLERRLVQVMLSGRERSFFLTDPQATWLLHPAGRIETCWPDGSVTAIQPPLEELAKRHPAFADSYTYEQLRQ